MSPEIAVALIIGIGGPSVLFALNRVFGGGRKDRLDRDAKVAELWKSWSEEQTKRIEALEEDVAELKHLLADEKATSQGLQRQNDRLSSLLTDLIRWAIQLRDEVIRLGGTVPPAPIAVESAMTNLDGQ